MKLVLSIFMLSICISSASVESDKEILEAIKDWRASIEKSPIKSDPKIIAMLGQGLRKLSRKNWGKYQEEADELYSKAQSTLLSIPGHGEYYSRGFIDAYKEARDEVVRTGYSGKWSEVLDKHMYEFITLRHIPTPESVAVLAGLFSEDWQPPADLANPTRMGIQSLPVYAVIELHKIGIRDGPTQQFAERGIPASLLLWKAWWEEVKSGKRTFSFKGQSVEYRFKPDGTWDTIPLANPPDDGPKPAVSPLAVPNPGPSQSAVEPVVEPAFAPWPWLIAAFSFVIAALGFLVWKGRTSRNDR